ncbi:MAG: DNA adenine methylase [Ignavibacteriaceae bacterium]|nr:DNA adenine methylase [Ignavibacteriaceae bacterium]
MATQLNIFGNDQSGLQHDKLVNIASIPLRSPFRYPGGKTWLIPTVRAWLKQQQNGKELIEPFAGGGIVSLTAAFEKLVDRITMVELDEEIAAVWEVILRGNNQWLANKIRNFDLTLENVTKELKNPSNDLHDIAFRTILKNRILHGGIIAKGSGIIKNGENGKGMASRWYPTTLMNRITAINLVKNKIDFIRGDAFEIIEKNLNVEDCFFFLDPPYTVAGKRLYTYFNVDHEKLFSLAAQIKGKFMLTYDDTSEIRSLANKYNLPYVHIPMKTTHHIEKNEIIISDNFNWLPNNN